MSALVNAATDQSPGSRPATLSAADLVIPFLQQLAITGVAISVFNHPGQRATVAASDAVVRRIDELQFELGEGPGFDVIASGTPWQIQPRGDSAGVNPFFWSAVQDLDVATIISLPLRLGSVSTGVATLYRQRLGLLNSAEMATATALVHWVSGPAIQRALVTTHDETGEPAEAVGGFRRDVHQATGMIIAQLDVDATDAFARLRAFAYTHNQTVQSVSEQVIRRELNFANLDR